MAERTAALVLSGGPHPFHESTPVLVELLRSASWRPEVVDHPEEAADTLARGHHPLLVCNTLRWRMLTPRYDELRPEHAYTTSPHVRDTFSAHVRAGGSLLALHAAPICFDDWPGWGELVGARWNWGTSSHPEHGEMLVEVVPTPHPITDGVGDFRITDEAYGRMWLADDVAPLAVSRWGGQAHPVLWARHVGDGRVVTDTLGHDASSFRHPSHDRILRQSLDWLGDASGGGA